MDDIKVPFPEEGKSGKDDGTAYQKDNVGQKLGTRNRRHLIVLNFGQVDSLNSVRENRNLMVFTKPLDQGGGDFSRAGLIMNTRRNDSDSQTYLREVPLTQGLSVQSFCGKGTTFWFKEPVPTPPPGPPLPWRLSFKAINIIPQRT